MEKLKSCKQEKIQGQRDERGRFVKGVSGNPDGGPKGCKRALTQIEEAIEEFEKKKGVSYWKAATIIAMKEANKGNTTLLGKILDKFVATKQEVSGNLSGPGTHITLVIPSERANRFANKIKSISI